jgi:hypothetical protein
VSFQPRLTLCRPSPRQASAAADKKLVEKKRSLKRL